MGIKRFIWAFVLIFPVIVSQAQETDLDKYKSMFTLNFLRYIDWPQEAKQGDFIIAVVNSKRVAGYLKSLSAGKKFGFQDIVVKEFGSIEEIPTCQIMFIGNGLNLSKAKDAIKAFSQKNKTLIITEREGAVGNGSMINFVVRDDKLKFELSPGNAQPAGLTFGSSLTTLANAIVL
jgi:hypothetical protein